LKISPANLTKPNNYIIIILRLKTESLDLKTQMTNLIEENKIMQEKYKSMFEKMQQEIRRKQLFIEELKNRVFEQQKKL
jgi:hypothetical protein